MRENTQNITPPFIDIKEGYLGEYSHFSKFHYELVAIAFECMEGCETPFGTSQRWVVPLGSSEEDDVSRSGVLGRFVLCPQCGSYKVRMLMAYPVIPRHKQYWFWDMTTVEINYDKASRTPENRPQGDGKEVAGSS